MGNSTNLGTAVLTVATEGTGTALECLALGASKSAVVAAVGAAQGTVEDVVIHNQMYRKPM